MAKQFNKGKDEIKYRINDEIRFLEKVRVVGDGITSEVVSLSKAKEMAAEKELDLVLINTQASPPITRICDYQKMIYEMKRNMKKSKSPSQQVKEIQLSVNISSNDMNTKAKQAMKFIENGNKVKVVLSMRGRELARREENKRSILEFLVMLEDVAKIESLKDENTRTIAIIKKK